MLQLENCMVGRVNVRNRFREATWKRVLTGKNVPETCLNQYSLQFEKTLLRCDGMFGAFSMSSKLSSTQTAGADVTRGYVLNTCYFETNYWWLRKRTLFKRVGTCSRSFQIFETLSFEVAFWNVVRQSFLNTSRKALSTSIQEFWGKFCMLLR